jgi:hypothetical protein
MRHKEYSSSKYNDIEMQAMNPPPQAKKPASPKGVFTIDEEDEVGERV